MFSKAKRFEPVGSSQMSIDPKKKPNKKIDAGKQQKNAKSDSNEMKPKKQSSQTSLRNFDNQSQCSSKQSVKSLVTPKPVKITVPPPSSLRKPVLPVLKNNENIKTCNEISDDIINAKNVEIRNKDYTILEYKNYIEELKKKLSYLQTLMKKANIQGPDVAELNLKFSQVNLNDQDPTKANQSICDYALIDNLKLKIYDLEQLSDKLEQEVSNKQVELSDLEETITIRDSLCKDLQDKLTNSENILDETRQRLEMVKGHHALALEANESIRREYKIEIETLKAKLEEDKQIIMNKAKADQEVIKSKYNSLIESIKSEITKDKNDIIEQMQQQLTDKENELKAKLEQVNEATQEKLKLCEIQYEERSRSMQEHCAKLKQQVEYSEDIIKDLKLKINILEEENEKLQKEVKVLFKENECIKNDKIDLRNNINILKEEAKNKYIDFENQINKLMVEVDKAIKEKNKFEMSLSVTRDIVQVLTMRLRESDNEIEHLENKIQSFVNSKEAVEEELSKYKTTLNNTVLECNEYKEALVNILKSKAALAKEHTRIMEHNVSLIESLQNVEKEAYRELGSIKNELIEDVELLKKESSSQIQILREEVEEKRMLCELAKEHAGQATAAAEESRYLLAQAAAEIDRLETDNLRVHQQVQDQQSLVIELSLLRQENEELTMTVAKQSSLIDKLKKETEAQSQQSKLHPKSPSAVRKSHKLGKENMQAIIVSPLRERNQ